MNIPAPQTIALIGLGEVGQTLAQDLRSDWVRIKTWDRLFVDPHSMASINLRDLAHVQGAGSLGAALSGASLVISAVTAGECLAAAREAAASLTPGAFYFDLNSVSPAAKTQAAGVVDSAGGRFVESAIMSPIAPRRIASPMLLGGPHARQFLPLAQSLGFAGAEVFSDIIGKSSAAKMCRSIVVKGMEALLTESLLAARHHGVEDAVLASLGDLFPGLQWRKLARYMVSRSLQHGARRAEEMIEAAQTAAEAHLTPWMSRACVERQAWAARRAGALEHEELNGMLDALLAEVETA